MKKNSRLVILIVLCVILAVIGWVNVKSSPQYSVYRLNKAIRSRDYATFSKYVDIDTIVESVVDEGIDRANKDAINEQNPNIKQIVGFSMVTQAAKPTIMDNIKKELKKQIEEKGELEKVTYKQDNLLTAMTEIKAVTDGKVADVTVPIANKPMYIKMRQVDGYWQMFDVDIDSPNFK